MELVQNVKDFHLPILETSQTATSAKNSFPWDRMTDGFSVESAFLVSYSEIQTYRQCERRHYYSFFKKQAPALQSAPIQIGILGHKLLEIYFENRDTSSMDSILEQIATFYTDQYMTLVENNVRSQTLVRMYERVLEFIGNDPFRNYEVIAIEETFVTPLNSQIGLAFTPDLILKNSQTDELHVVDHKFIGRQWNSVKLMVTTQLDVYAAALRYHNINIASKMYNFMGTTAPIIPQIEQFQLNDYKARRIFEELLIYARRIHDTALVTENLQDYYSKRILDPVVCQWCPFLDECYGELTGNERAIERATKTMIPNTYGYRKEQS